VRIEGAGCYNRPNPEQSKVLGERGRRCHGPVASQQPALLTISPFLSIVDIFVPSTFLKFSIL